VEFRRARAGYLFVWGGIVVRLTRDEMVELMDEAKKLMEE
jgi:hypothetical protein